mmetsp:Transcript_17575/g.37310  ORF Transcript_17575/g.37310 Transcript_17575/m.37310 type:complete len:219 (+) Transcript_17575:177-833(+)
MSEAQWGRWVARHRQRKRCAWTGICSRKVASSVRQVRALSLAWQQPHGLFGKGHRGRASGRRPNRGCLPTSSRAHHPRPFFPRTLRRHPRAAMFGTSLSHRCPAASGQRWACHRLPHSATTRPGPWLAELGTTSTSPTCSLRSTFCMVHRRSPHRCRHVLGCTGCRRQPSCRKPTLSDPPISGILPHPLPATPQRRGIHPPAATPHQFSGRSSPGQSG